MKQKFLLLTIVVIVIGLGKVKAQFIDLSTGKTVTLVKHNGNGMMYNTQTQRPVHIYVNTATNDTFYGRTGEIINGKVMRNSTGRYTYEGDGEYVYKEGEYRMKSEVDSAGYKKVFQRDGDVKVKYGNYKRKAEIDGDVKVKDGDAKTKLEEDGTRKVKDGAFRSKKDKAGNVRVKDDSSKVKINTDGSIKVKDKREDYKGKADGNGKVKEKEGNTKSKVKGDKTKVKTGE
ncbi:MAG: hypothetical protein JWQ09_2277 [Segetibacter sp.]|nr:hypothetical protein [Segetibacter sp.]